MPRWLLLALSLTGCSPGVIALDVPDSADAFAIVTHAPAEGVWYAQVEGGQPSVVTDTRDLEVFVFKSKFDLPQGNLQFLSTGRGAFPPPDSSYRLVDKTWQTSTPGAEFFEFRYEPETPPCPTLDVLGLQATDTDVVTATTLSNRILAFTSAGEVLIVESAQPQMTVNTALVGVTNAASVANQIYMLIGEELVRGDLASNLNDRNAVSSDRIVALYQGHERVFALTEASVLLEFDAGGLKSQVTLPAAGMVDRAPVALIDSAAGTWIGRGNTLFAWDGSGVTEVASFSAAITAVVTVRDDPVVFAGDVYRVVGSTPQRLLADPGPAIFAAVEWTDGFVAALRTGTTTTASELLTFDTDNARHCEFGRTVEVGPFLRLFGANPMFAVTDTTGRSGLALLVER